MRSMRSLVTCALVAKTVAPTTEPVTTSSVMITRIRLNHPCRVNLVSRGAAARVSGPGSIRVPDVVVVEALMQVSRCRPTADAGPRRRRSGPPVGCCESLDAGDHGVDEFVSAAVDIAGTRVAEEAFFPPSRSCSPIRASNSPSVNSTSALLSSISRVVFCQRPPCCANPVPARRGTRPTAPPRWGVRSRKPGVSCPDHLDGAVVGGQDDAGHGGEDVGSGVVRRSGPVPGSSSLLVHRHR